MYVSINLLTTYCAHKEIHLIRESSLCIGFTNVPLTEHNCWRVQPLAHIIIILHHLLPPIEVTMNTDIL